MKQQDPCEAMGWLLVAPAALPQAWADRAIPMVLVPLLPDELAGQLSPERGDGLSGQDAALLDLVVSGLSKQRMARVLGISTRTLDRRLRALRERLGVHSLTELAAAAARRGFGGQRPADPPQGTHT